MRRRPWLLLPLLSLLLVLAAGVLRVRAEEDEDEPGQRTMPFAVRDTSSARYAVKETGRLLQSGQTTRALRLAQEVLDEYTLDLYRLPGPPESIRWRLATEEIRDRLASLSTADRAVYERLVRAATVPLMEDALARRDPSVLARVVDRFGASRTGVEAARLLADLALEEGRGRDAALWTARGLRFAPRDGGLWTRHIDALGTEADAVALAALAERLSKEERALPVPGGAATVGQHLASWRQRLPPPPEVRGWPIWGGKPARSGHAPSTGPRPDSLRWVRHIPFPAGLLDSDPFRGGLRNREQYFLEAWGRFRPLHPVVEERIAYVADGRAIRALDLYSGMDVWTFDWEYPTHLDLIRPEDPGLGRTSLERAYSPVIHGDRVLGTIEVRHDYDRDMLQTVEISTYLPHRVLVALDKKDGRLLWAMGTHPDDVKPLDGVTVVSPCVVAENLVVAVTAHNDGGFHRVSLIAVDLETGRLAWQRSLGYGNQELNLFGAAVKELAASAPAVKDGVVYASTGLGFVAAVELRTGRPRWLGSYEIQPIEPVQVWYEAPLRFPRVAPSPAVVTGDVALFAPTDGMHVYAFDRRDGSFRWRVPYPGRAQIGAPAHFLGVVNDGKREVALLTGTDLEAYDVSNGTRVWIGRLQETHGERNVPIGRGAVTEEHVLVPTNNGLVRFSLAREGSFEGRDPWPTHVTPGNLLPLARLLLVTGRESLQAFYSWEEIERDIVRRQQAHPNDPSVLLEAGEIYRMGGALDRARKAFHTALDIATRGAGDRAAEASAARGLYLTWRSASSGLESVSPEQARGALGRALEWARTAQERVEARLALDRLLEALPEERVANLERLVDEAGSVRATFPGDEEDAPARAMALLKLAQVRTEMGRAADAIESLQLLLREEGDEEIRGENARDLAREYIDEITRVWGREAYRRHEDEAQRLLEKAKAENGADLLDRILREYPNATVVPAALLGLGGRYLSEGLPARAAGVLRRLLADFPEDPGAAKAAALLARAYDALGLDGARAFAYAWLAARHPDAKLEIEGSQTTGAALAAAERRPPRRILPPRPEKLVLPLREVLFESVGDEAWGRQIHVASADPERAPSPLTLLTDGRSITAFDLTKASVAFRLEPGSCHRAFYDDGILVLALSRALMGVTADTGQPLWEVPVEGNTLDLEGGQGQVYALVHDTSGRRGERSVVAVDLVRGKVVWTLPLGGHADFRDLRVHGTDLLLREARYQGGRIWPTMLVVDGLAGRLRHVIGLPAENTTEADPVVVGDHLIVTARDTAGTRHLTAHDIQTGEVAWTHPLPGRTRVCGLLPHGDAIVVLQADGTLGTYRGTDGAPTDLTKIFVGEGGDAAPFHGTAPLLSGSRLVLMPRIASPPVHVGAWDRKTGKLAWLASWDEDKTPSRSTLALEGDAVLALTPFTPPRSPARVLLRILDAETGTVRLDVEPMGLTAEFGLLSMTHGWGTVVVFGRAGAVLYAASTAGR